jgi:polyribonucleotide nucleotidyltransferase
MIGGEHMFKIILPNKQEITCEDEKTVIEMAKKKANELNKTLLIKQEVGGRQIDYGVVYPGGEFGKITEFGMFKNLPISPTQKKQEKLEVSPKTEFGLFQKLAKKKEKK